MQGDKSRIGVACVITCFNRFGRIGDGPYFVNCFTRRYATVFSRRIFDSDWGRPIG